MCGARRLSAHAEARVSRSRGHNPARDGLVETGFGAGFDLLEQNFDFDC